MKKVILLALLVFPLIGFGQKKYVIISGDQTELSVREFGVGNPVVLLAGGPGISTDYLRPVWENLRSNFRCIVLDQRGTPNSFVSSVDSVSMSTHNYLNDLTTLQEHLNLEQMVIVGHSMGCLIARLV
jgi:proline iminopeptidase